jgi:hypothetical protein
LSAVLIASGATATGKYLILPNYGVGGSIISLLVPGIPDNIYGKYGYLMAMLPTAYTGLSHPLMYASIGLYGNSCSLDFSDRPYPDMDLWLTTFQGYGDYELYQQVP